MADGFLSSCFQLYPLWLCPATLKHVPGLVHPNGKQDEMYVDIGAYGNPVCSKFKGPTTISEVEQFVIENHG